MRDHEMEDRLRAMVTGMVAGEVLAGHTWGEDMEIPFLWGGRPTGIGSVATALIEQLARYSPRGLPPCCAVGGCISEPAPSPPRAHGVTALALGAAWARGVLVLQDGEFSFQPGLDTFVIGFLDRHCSPRAQEAGLVFAQILAEVLVDGDSAWLHPRSVRESVPPARWSDPLYDEPMPEQWVDEASEPFDRTCPSALEALAAVPNTPSAAHQLARALCLIQQGDEPAEILRQAAAITPNHGLSAVVGALLGARDGVMPALEKAFGCHPLRMTAELVVDQVIERRELPMGFRRLTSGADDASSETATETDEGGAR